MSSSPSALEPSLPPPPESAAAGDSTLPAPGLARRIRAKLALAASGPLLLFVSAMLWGTNPPAMRYLFLTAHPPSPAVISAVQSAAAAVFMLLFSFLLTRRARAEGIASAREPRGSSPGSAPPAAPVTPAAMPSGTVQVLASAPGGRLVTVEVPVGFERPIVRLQRLVRAALGTTTDNIYLAGLELGLIGFFANCATVIGFEQTTASRGAFLIRLSVVFTALLAAASGERLAAIVWAGTALACGGGLLVSADRTATLGAEAGVLPTGGDALIVLGAVLWALQTVRLGRHAPRFAAVRLTSLQLLTMAVLSAVWLGGDVVAALSQGLSAEIVWPGFRDPLAWLMLLYPALGPWGIATALQVKAQNRVSPSQTQIIYATDPLWATLFAGFLGASEQHLGVLGWLGAAAIVLATVISSRGNLKAH